MLAELFDQPDLRCFEITGPCYFFFIPLYLDNCLNLYILFDKNLDERHPPLITPPPTPFQRSFTEEFTEAIPVSR